MVKLTGNMVQTLGSIKRMDTAGAVRVLFPRDMCQAERNAARALIRRGLICFDTGLLGYSITDAGRAALREHE